MQFFFQKFSWNWFIKFGKFSVAHRWCLPLLIEMDLVVYPKSALKLCFRLISDIPNQIMGTRTVTILKYKKGQLKKVLSHCFLPIRANIVDFKVLLNFELRSSFIMQHISYCTIFPILALYVYIITSQSPPKKIPNPSPLNSSW